MRTKYNTPYAIRFTPKERQMLAAVSKHLKHNKSETVRALLRDAYESMKPEERQGHKQPVTA